VRGLGARACYPTGAVRGLGARAARGAAPRAARRMSGAGGGAPSGGFDRRSLLATRLLDYIRDEARGDLSPAALATTFGLLKAHQLAARGARARLPGAPAALDAAALREAAWASHHASAAYGAVGASFIALLDPRPLAELGLWARVAPLLRGEEAAYAGRAALAGGRADVLAKGGGAAAGGPRWFLADDARAGALVLAIRGTLSLGDLVTDALGTEEPFAWGVAHAGIADAARGIWAEARPLLEAALEARPGRRVVVTGHSLGGAAAQLVVVLAAFEAERGGGRWPLGGAPLSAVAFAPPPAYAGPPLPPTVAARAYLHEWDAVARLSLRSVRELARAASALAAATPLAARLARARGPLEPRELAALARAEPAWVRAWGGAGAAAAVAEAEAEAEAVVAAAAATAAAAGGGGGAAGSAAGGGGVASAGAAAGGGARGAPPAPLLRVIGDIFAFRDPAHAAALAAREDAAEAAAAAAAAAAAGAAAAAAAEAAAEERAAAALSPRAARVARAWALVARAELAGRARALAGAVARGLAAAAAPPPPPAPARGALLTRVGAEDADMASLPLFGWRGHVPDRYVHALAALAAHATAAEAAAPAHAPAPAPRAGADAVVGGAKAEAAPARPAGGADPGR